MNKENPHNFSNNSFDETSASSPCFDNRTHDDKGALEGKPYYSSYHTPTGKRCKRKRGPKRKQWARRDEYNRRFNPNRLRRCQVDEIIAADLFASRTQKRLCTFITIRWPDLPPREIQGAWGRLLNASRIWSSRHALELAHVWVHENPPRGDPGFHTHMLCNVPPSLRAEFDRWLHRQLNAEPGAIDLQPRTAPDWRRPDDRVSYLCKGTDKCTALDLRLIRKHGWDFQQGIVPFKRCGTSRNINANARKQEGNNAA